MKNSLHQKFIDLGRERNKITYKLLALLPKIYKMHIDKKEGYATIYEYAGKLAGLSHGVVEKTLRTNKNLDGKPYLQKAVETQGIHKVALVVKLATSKTDAAWADKVENMSKTALAELAQEVRMKHGNAANVATAGACAAAPVSIKIELNAEMQFMFLKLKKQFGDNLSNKEVMRRILRKLTMEEKNPRGWIKTEKGQCVKSVTRYVPVQQKRTVLGRSNGKCSYPGCNRPSDMLHNRGRFYEKQSHHSVVPLCKIHHEFAHNGLISNEKAGEQNWRLNIDEGVHTYSDAMFRGYKMI